MTNTKYGFAGLDFEAAHQAALKTQPPATMAEDFPGQRGGIYREDVQCHLDRQHRAIVEAHKELNLQLLKEVGALRARVAELKTNIKVYTLEEIKIAFWKKFHKSGGLWFNYLGSEEECEINTKFVWRTFSEHLTGEEENDPTSQTS